MLTRLLTVLPLLLCPLLMLVCMWAMRNRGPADRQARPEELPTAARVAQRNANSPSSAGTFPGESGRGIRLGRAGRPLARFTQRHTGAAGLTGRR
jgi:hypothetical protein